MFHNLKTDLKLAAQENPAGTGKPNKGPVVIGSIAALAALGFIGYRVFTKTAETPTGDTTGATAGSVVLQLWDQEEAENTAVMDSWIARFQTDNPNIKIIRQTYPNEDLRTKFTTAATGGQAADLVWGPNDVAGVFATANIIQPVENFVDTNQFTPAVLEAIKLDGKVMGMPATYGNTLVLLYNTSKVPTPPKTTDELIAVAKQHTNEASNTYGLAFFQNEPFWFAPIMGGFGAWPLAIEGTNVRVELDSEGTKQALQFLKDLKYVHKIIPNECDYDCAKGLFLEEKAALHINGDWSVKEYVAKLGDKVGIAPLPVISQTGKPMTPMVSGRYVFVNAQLAPEKTDAVKKFLGFLSSKDVQVEVATKLGRVPATKEAQADPATTQTKTVKALLDAAVNGKPMPAQNEMRAAWDAMRPYQQKVMSGDTPPNEAANLMQQSALEKLASLKK